jgi:hypothetical protein
MTPLVKGLVLGGVQIALVASLGGKLLLDRSTMPRAWVETRPYDPNLPIRGRYVSLRIAAEAQGFGGGVLYAQVKLSVENGKLIARPTESGLMASLSAGEAVLSEPVAYFIPENIPDPSRRPPGEQLWVEVTIPPKGPPRPIQLGVKKDGKLTPLGVF